MSYSAHNPSSHPLYLCQREVVCKCEIALHESKIICNSNVAQAGSDLTVSAPPPLFSSSPPQPFSCPLPLPSHRQGSSTVTRALLNSQPRLPTRIPSHTAHHHHHHQHLSSSAHFAPTPRCTAAAFPIPGGSSRSRMSIVCGDTGKRRRLIKTRVVRPFMRGKRKFADEPHRLSVSVSSPEYAGRLTTAINSTNGPLQMEYLLNEHGLNFTATQVRRKVMFGRVDGRTSAGWLSGLRSDILHQMSSYQAAEPGLTLCCESDPGFTCTPFNAHSTSSLVSRLKQHHNVLALGCLCHEGAFPQSLLI